MQYEVKRGPIGAPKVVYTCPRCGIELESRLIEAGQPDECPGCHHRYTVPGAEELAKHRAKIEYERQQQEAAAREQDRRAIAERAERMLKAQQKEEQRRAKSERAAAETLPAGTLDRFLYIAFRFAKVASVLIVSICFIAIVSSLIMLLSVQAHVPPRPPATTSLYPTPTFAAYREQTQRQQQSSRQTQSSPDKPMPPVLPTDPWQPQINQLLQEYPALNRHVLERHIYEDVDIRYDRREFLEGLKPFIEQAQLEGFTPSGAMSVYHTMFEATLRQREIDRVTRDADQRRWEIERTIAEAEASGQRILYGSVVAGSIAGLLTFLVIPLLIQIEQNTRRRIIVSHGASES